MNDWSCWVHKRMHQTRSRLRLLSIGLLRKPFTLSNTINNPYKPFYCTFHNHHVFHRELHNVKHDPDKTSTLESNISDIVLGIPNITETTQNTHHNGQLHESTDTDNDSISPIDTDAFQKSMAHPTHPLRHNQQKCVNSIFDYIKSGGMRGSVSMPTGSGKTVIFSHLVAPIKPKEGQGNRVLVLVNRREIAAQAMERMKSINPSLTVEIEMGNDRATDSADIIIASVNTLGYKGSTRLGESRFDPKTYKLIIIDEAHHAAANSYNKILTHFSAATPETSIYVIGFSATIIRHDKKSLHGSSDKVIHHMDMADAIRDGTLSDFKATTIQASFDMMSVINQEAIEAERIKSEKREFKSKVEYISEKMKTATEEEQEKMREEIKNLGLGIKKLARVPKDFNMHNLSQAINTSEVNELVFSTWLKYQESMKSTLVFCVDIAHTRDLCKIFRDHGIAADYVTGETKDTNRADIITSFKEGKIRVLFNCAVFTEGTDIPNIDTIFMLRPSRSLTLFTQMLGRGLRLHKGKCICNVFDFVGNLPAHKSGMITTSQIMGLKADAHLNGMSFLEHMKMKEEDERKRELRRRELEAQMKFQSNELDYDNDSDSTDFVRRIVDPETILERSSGVAKSNGEEYMKKKKLEETAQLIEEYKSLLNPENREASISDVKMTTFEGILDFLNISTVTEGPEAPKPRNDKVGTKETKRKDTTNPFMLDLSQSPNMWIQTKEKEYVLGGIDRYLRLSPSELDGTKCKLESVSQFTKFDFSKGKKARKFSKNHIKVLNNLLEKDQALKMADLETSFLIVDQPEIVVHLINKKASWRGQTASQSQIKTVKKILRASLKTKKIKQLHQKYVNAGPIIPTNENLEQTDPTQGILKDPEDDSFKWVEKITKGNAHLITSLSVHGGLTKLIETYYRRLINLRKKLNKTNNIISDK